MAEKRSMWKLLSELNHMWMMHGSFLPGAENFTYEMTQEKIAEIEQFHHDELQRLADELTPMSRADYRRMEGRE